MLRVALRLLSSAIRTIIMRRRIHVTLIGQRADLALVHIRHGLLSRLAYSEPEADHIVCCVPDVGGGRLWIYDSPQRRVTDRGVIAALEREWRRATHDRINSECWAAIQAIVERRD